MRTLSLAFLLLTLACGQKKNSPVPANRQDPVTCFEGQNLVGLCLPAAAWTLRTEAEGIPKKLSLSINSEEYINECEDEVSGITVSIKDGIASIIFGFIGKPNTDSNDNIEIFNCEDGRRFAHALPAVYTITRKAGERVYDVSCELTKD